MSRFNLA